MDEDFRVKPLSDEQIRTIAKQTRQFFGVADQAFVDIISCLKNGEVQTVYGLKSLSLSSAPDAQMGAAEGLTTFVRRHVSIKVKQSVLSAAEERIGHARNTLAHELGHAVLHEGPAMQRNLAAVTPKWIRTFESAEHQVKVFAPAFLINDGIAANLPDYNEIAQVFGISKKSAKIYFDQLEERRKKPIVAAKFSELVSTLREANSPKLSPIQFLKERCTTCGNPTIFPVGSKFMCQTCDTVSDCFQDGDVTEP